MVIWRTAGALSRARGEKGDCLLRRRKASGPSRRLIGCQVRRWPDSLVGRELALPACGVGVLPSTAVRREFRGVQGPEMRSYEGCATRSTASSWRTLQVRFLRLFPPASFHPLIPSRRAGPRPRRHAPAHSPRRRYLRALLQFRQLSQRPFRFP